MMRKKTYILFVSILVLTGCSAAANGAPSHHQIKKAVSQMIKNADAKIYKQAKAGLSKKDVQQMGIPSPNEIKINNVQVQNTKKLENGDYKMRINYKDTVKMPNKSKSKTDSNIFIMHHKNNGKWIAEKPSNG